MVDTPIDCVAVVTPLLHKYVLPFTALVPIVAFGVVQVIVLFGPASAVILPTVTVNGSTALHPLLSTTVTVYVAFVVGILLLLPVPNPPLHV